MYNKKIAIIGSGNVAWHLTQVFFENNILVSEVYSRNLSEANNMAKKTTTKVIESLNLIGQNTDIIFLAVSDDSIVNVAEKLDCKGKTIVHCSGIADTKVLRKASKNFGCFYPLQSFSKYVPVEFSQIPILITASNTQTEKTLLDLAHLISKTVQKISDTQRQKLHLSAVIVNNFTNHLFTLSASYLEQNDIDFKLLKPLIHETVSKIAKQSPKSNQTGPAKRNDIKTIEKHFRLIENEDMLEVYKVLTKSIYTTHNE